MPWRILTGDCIEQMRTLPDESVHCCVTSPPYWGLRDYGVDGQLGLEETPEQFVALMVDVFSEVRRVLRSDGTLWLNIGDSYNAGAAARREPARESYGKHDWMGGSTVRAHTPDLKPKDLVGVPWMLAFALRADGWWLRAENIWNKKNPMPESVLDRPTRAHEQLFLLSKSPRYYYDAEAIREPATWGGQNRSDRGPRESAMPGAPSHKGLRQDKQRGHGRRHDGFNDRWDAMSKEEQQALGRNKRSVWTIATRPFPDAHFATFPPDLVEPCILAGTSPRVCGECGAPWRRQLQRGEVGDWNPRTASDERVAKKGTKFSGNNYRDHYEPPRTLGWEPTCDCHRQKCISCTNPETGDLDPHCCDCTGAEPIYESLHPTNRAVVLDPFAGAATTVLVATQHGRDSIGIELNPEYVALGEQRIRRWEANPSGALSGHVPPLEGQIGLEIA